VEGSPSTPAEQEMITAVRALLRAGLPPADSHALDGLLDSRGVIARAVSPADRSSRLRALDGLLRWQLARFEHLRLAEPARLLFGAATEVSGLTLTERRARAAAAADYEVHHFRKQIEPQICHRLAIMLAADAAEALVRAVPPRLSRPRRPLRLPADVFAWEAAEHEQAVATLWAEVYALRAALLAVARVVCMHGATHPETGAATETALWRAALLHHAVLAYQDAYGPQLLGADLGVGPEDLAAMAGWHPALDPAVQSELAALAATHPTPDDFLRALPAPAAEAAHVWRRELAEQSTAER
jgi:hypothetical protein